MGEDREDPQKLKRMAAAAYDYENDSRWADYWSNVLIPPHLASRSDVVEHFKRKFYQRFIDSELVVEPMPTSSPAQPPRPPATTSSIQSPRRNEQAHYRSGSINRTSGTSAATGPNSSPSRWDRQTILFSVNAWVFVVAILAVIPLVPKNLSHRAYRLSFMVALIPLLCRSLEHVAKFLRRNFSRSNLYRKYLEGLCVWVESNNTIISILTSHVEIGVGFLLIISLFSWQRNIIQTFLYWQLLKLMYHAPVTAAYHQNVWAKIGRTINPSINRHAPFLNTPISSVRRWWFR